MHGIVITPHEGALRLARLPEADPVLAKGGDIPAELVASFGESVAAGLTDLASERWGEKVATWPAEFSFWRGYARSYFAALCRQTASKGRRWSSPSPPDEGSIEILSREAPPMQGLEYLSPATFKGVWQGLDEITQARVAKRSDGVSGYLKLLDPSWNLIGRVTFHLAENKKNADAPFAFLATYTQSGSAGGTPQHSPLSEALRESITAKDVAKLDQLLEPVTRAAQRCPWVAAQLESRKLFTPQSLGIREAYTFLQSAEAMEQAGIVVRVPNWWNATRPPRPQVSVKLGSKAPSVLGADTLDFSIDVAIEGESLNAEELKRLLESRDQLVLLRGKWVEVDREHLKSALSHWKELQKHHVSGIDFLQGMRMLSGVAIGGDDADVTTPAWSRVEAGPWLQSVLQGLRNPGGEVTIDPEAGIDAKLRPYQAQGVRWLWFATQLGLGVCLADDMGLGKTLQVISLIVQLRRQARGRDEASTPCLLIVPTSLVGNWQREVARFAPDLKLFVAHRSVSSPEELARVAAKPAKELASFDAVLITYGMVRKAEWLRDVKWRLIVLDEAQAIKNAASAQAKAIKEIPARCRITMTGTPIENNLGDLWSLFDFSSPGLLGGFADFKRFVAAKDDSQRLRRLAALRSLVRPYVLRRLKTDPRIAPDLPDKTEVRVDCGLMPPQAALYAEVIKDLKMALKSADGIRRRGIVLSALMQLKQICDHPALYMKRADFVPGESGKYQELARICEVIARKQEKVLVFSQFRSMCEPLAEFLAGVFGRSGLVLTGETTAKGRSKLVAEFQQESGPPFMVISVKAGGVGLNLTEACHVVHFDRWWNPAVEDQATDRAFRIGQKRNVLVHKFVSRGTLEERIDDLIRSKRQLARDLFDSSGEPNLTEMSNEQLLDFVALDLTKSSAN